MRRLAPLTLRAAVAVSSLLLARPDLAQEASPPSFATSGRFVREHWAEFGPEHANPMSNRRFRVNSPEVALHPNFGSRSEVQSSGCLRLLMPEDPRLLSGAELYVELWGGHPGTANRRVTVNGRTTYHIADHGGQSHCTYQYPRFELKRTDLVNGYNALQFAVDQGQTFWGHMIVDNACLRAILNDDHPDLERYQLVGFRAGVSAAPREGERLQLSLDVPEKWHEQIASVKFHGFYDGYDENGDTQTRDWHGFTKARQPQAILGATDRPPFSLMWDTSLVPDQAEVAVRAIVRLKAAANLCYHTPPLANVKLPERRGKVQLVTANDLPAPFWSRASRRKACTLRLDADPARIERAELHVVVWDGGKGKVEEYFTLNGQPLAVAGSGRHDLLYTKTTIDPALLKRGDNEIVLLSDTEHHGIEICLPGPALVVRTRGATGERAKAAKGKSDEANAAAAKQSYEQRALTTAGDPARGKALFLNESRSKCTVCHKLDGQGGDAGPDLSVIGGKYARPHLIESLLEPSRQLVEGFRTSVLALADGRVITGIVKGETSAGLIVVDAEGKQQVVPLADIERRQESGVSLMPEGLEKTLTADEFTDLVAFLESRRPAGKGTPGSNVAGGIGLPEGFRVAVVATGLTGATALETLPDGRVLICEQTGALRVLKDGRLLPRAALELTVNPTWERGLIGVTVSPDFPRTGHVYVCYVARTPFPHHRVSRFVMHGDVIDSASEKVLLRGDDQTKLGGKVPAGHQGGALHFGPDGKLYIGIGEQTAGQPSQELDTFLGKLLRIDADGSIPSDNPFYHQAEGKYRAIWARGLRNPFTFAIHPPSGQMLINDIGGDKFEEVNRGVAGGNYGWPLSEGPTTEPRIETPVFYYPRASICGADFAPDDSSLPAELQGQYFFADFIHGWIKTLDPHDPANVRTFATGLRNPVDLRFASDGRLYVLLRNAWVIDNKFQPGTGSLLRIDSTGDRLSR